MLFASGKTIEVNIKDIKFKYIKDFEEEKEEDNLYVVIFDAIDI
jgi:hypothetical protein